jgi:undecaprenyl diphosphate synthase
MFHVAIIMDGNGRWASARGLPRLAGHAQGAEALRRTVEAAPSLGVTDLTVYAFSSDNWSRPPAEVAGLMRLLAARLPGETRHCLANGVRVTAIGRRDRLPAAVLREVDAIERATEGQPGLRLRVALDYSSRDRIGHGDLVPDVDLLIRTAGEQRLSDFLLWECAYAEFHFTPTLWPDFGRADLAAAVADFQRRQRKFGGLPAGYCGVPA